MKRAVAVIYFVIFQLCALIGLKCTKDQPPDSLLHPYASADPISIPKKFEIPGMGNVWHITFEPDGKTLYFVTIDNIRKMEIVKYSRFENNQWSIPQLADFSGQYRIETPHVSPNGTKLFFTYAVSGHEDIYVMEKSGKGWSMARSLGTPVNSSEFDSSPSTTLSGNLYFLSFRSGRAAIYLSRFIDGVYAKPELLDDNINRYNVGEIYVAPDESYLLFDIYTPPDNSQLHISFNNNGSWSVPQNLGSVINFTNFQKRPCVSPDGNYLFYTANNGIFQVDFKPVLDSLKNY